MGLFFLWLGLAFATQIWLCIRVARSSIALAIVTFFIGSIGSLYTLFKHRGDPETSVTVPFVANLVFSVLFFVSLWQVVLPKLEAIEDEFEAPVAAAMAPTTDRASSPALVPAVAATSASAAEAPASAASGAAPADSVDVFSAALRDGGLVHTVTRLPASSSLPPGVTDATLFSVTPMGSAASPASAASAAVAANELSATLFKCESVNACRNLAGAYMQQTGASKRRVLQNGLLMLSLPPSEPNDADLTPAAVASVFRKL
ncbi:MAG: hypothetical protein IV105_19825 [Rhizobacter sp.]|nr:hypothetical protein [Rhizobacter sp.]